MDLLNGLLIVDVGLGPILLARKCLMALAEYEVTASKSLMLHVLHKTGTGVAYIPIIVLSYSLFLFNALSII